MTSIEIITLFVIMVVLAAIPGTSVALVVIRSATLGVANGFAVTAGIVLGDLVFVMLAILGLSFVAETMGGLFMVIKYLGAFYLLWLGFSLLKSQNITQIKLNNSIRENGNLVTSFLAGAILTLGDVKAIIFYVSLFPIFIDLSTLDAAKILVIILVTVVSVGGVKILYALSAKKIVNYARKLKFENTVRKTAGGLMVGAGTWLMIKT